MSTEERFTPTPRAFAEENAGDRGLERRYVAILHADVAGYSRLMEEDEEGAYRTLRDHLGILGGAVARYGGRICNVAGDALLAEFDTAARALNCAVATQRHLAERNGRLPEGRRLELRIGINAGTVIVDGDDIYGHAVNVAARLEGLAEAGGICISARVLELAGDQPKLGLVHLGLRFVKNIERPADTWRVVFDSEAAAAAAGGAASRRGARTLHVIKTAAFSFGAACATKLQRHISPRLPPSLFHGTALQVPSSGTTH